MDSTSTDDEQRLIDVWEDHLRCEFADRDAAATVATMSDASVLVQLGLLDPSHLPVAGPKRPGRYWTPGDRPPI